MAADPAPLTDNDRYRLSWDAATERFYDSAYTGSRLTSQKLTDVFLSKVHKRIASWDIFRYVSSSSYDMYPPPPHMTCILLLLI
jgi:hypothetical protein